MSIYSTKDAYEVYCYFLALKQHFTSNYDFFKYNGKTSTNPTAFENRKDKFHYYKLSKHSDAKNYVLANILENPNIWIGDIVNDDKSEGIYLDWKKRKQSLSYVFKNELSVLNEDFNDNLLSTDGQHPPLLKHYIRGDICIETLTIIANITKVFSHWDKVLLDKILYPDINRKCKKYFPFMEYDKIKMKKILLDNFEQTV